MSVVLMRAVWDCFARGGSHKLVLLALADWADDNGGSLFPSMAAIAKKVSMSPCQARRIVHGFIDEGLLEVVANAAGGRPGTTPNYRLRLDRLAPSPIADASRAPVADNSPTSVAHVRGVVDVRAGTDALEGSRGCAGRASTRESQSVIYPSENHQRRARELEDICKANGVVHLRAQVLKEWEREELSHDLLREAIAVARGRKPAPQPIHLNYLVPILVDIRKGPRQRDDVLWRRDPDLAAAKGRELGISPRVGEELPQYVSRIDAALNDRRLRAVA